MRSFLSYVCNFLSVYVELQHIPILEEMKLFLDFGDGIKFLDFAGIL